MLFLVVKLFLISVQFWPILFTFLKEISCPVKKWGIFPSSSRHWRQWIPGIVAFLLFDPRYLLAFLTRFIYSPFWPAFLTRIFDSASFHGRFWQWCWKDLCMWRRVIPTVMTINYFNNDRDMLIAIATIMMMMMMIMAVLMTMVMMTTRTRMMMMIN